MISEVIRFFCAVESMCHPWKQFRWWFLRPQGLFALSNPCVTRGSSFVDDFLSRQRHSFEWWFLSLQGLFPLSNLCVTRGSSFVEDFWGHTGCFCCRIPASPVEAVSLKISDTTKRLMSSPKCRSVEVINNSARPGSNHRVVNYINYR
jgi:hypothetical protein